MRATCLAVGAALLLLFCSAGAVSARGGDDPPGGDSSSCTNVACSAGSHCERVSGRATCVADTSATCTGVQCPPGKTCIVEKGKADCVSVCRRVNCALAQICVADKDNKPQCVPAGTNPCGTGICPVGSICMPEPADDSPSVHCLTRCPAGVGSCPSDARCYQEVGDDSTKCIGKCATKKCPRGQKCVINRGSNAQCVPLNANPCSYTACPVGSLCRAERKPGESSSSAHCLNRCTRPCPRGTRCWKEPGDKSTKCLSKCEAVRCTPPRRCIINKAGNAQCVARSIIPT